MYELIILSLLMRARLHGYLIAKITNDQIGPWAKLSSGTMYTILARLEQAGLIAVVPPEHEAAPGDRRARTFTITEEGRKRFHQLMMDTSFNLGEYDKVFRYKMVYSDLLRPAERLLLLNHYINYCQTTMLYLQSEREALAYELGEQEQAVYLGNAVNVMQHLEHQWQGELDWVRALRERELTTQDAPASSDGGVEE